MQKVYCRRVEGKLLIDTKGWCWKRAGVLVHSECGKNESECLLFTKGAVARIIDYYVYLSTASMPY
jgi:hypothetical protein